FSLFCNWSTAPVPAEHFDVVLVREGEDVAVMVILWPAGAAEDLMGRARVHQLLLAEWPFDERGQDHGARWQVDSRGERLRADGYRQQLANEELLDDATILRQHAAVGPANAPPQPL